MSMNGIDISSWQEGLDLSKVPFDFCIIKATEGTKLVQPTCDPWVQYCIQNGKLWGFYHFGAGGDPIKEADWFVSNTKNYFGHGIPVFDYEDYGRFGTDKAKQFLDRVYELTGVRCVVYTSRSVLKEEDWSKIAPNHRLWVAQYANYNPTGYQDKPWIQEGTFGAWDSIIIHQYSSAGRLNGWNDNLDLDKAYITPDEWRAIARGNSTSTSPKPEEKKTIDQLAREVLDRQWGDGEDRKKRLEAEGYDYYAVQDRVNEILNSAFKAYKAQVTAKEGLNCRKEPNDKSGILKAYRYGETITINKEQSGWGYTGEGWVSLAYVKKTGSAPAQKTYTVKAGDTLSGIAAKFGTTYQKLAEYNGIPDPNKIIAGQVIKIPG